MQRGGCEALLVARRRELAGGGGASECARRDDLVSRVRLLHVSCAYESPGHLLKMQILTDGSGMGLRPAFLVSPQVLISLLV